MCMKVGARQHLIGSTSSVEGVEGSRDRWVGMEGGAMSVHVGGGQVGGDRWVGREGVRGVVNSRVWMEEWMEGCEMVRGMRARFPA